MKCKSVLSNYKQYDFLKYFPHLPGCNLYIDPVSTLGFSKNSPELEDDILYARDLESKNILLMRHYPGRRYFIYKYDFNNEAENLYEIYMD